MLPGSSRRWAGALFTASDGRAEPQCAVPLMAQAARRLGATIAPTAPPEASKPRADVSVASSPSAARSPAGAVVLAGGAWSRLFCGNMGVDFPQLKVLGSVMRTEPLNGPPELAVAGPDFAFRKRADGGYTVARRNKYEAHIVPDSFRLLPQFLPTMISTRREYRIRRSAASARNCASPRRWSLGPGQPRSRPPRVLDPAPNQAIVEESRRNLINAFPAFGGARDHGKLGRVDRLNAGCSAGDRAGALGPRFLPHERIFRTWFWHRARRRRLMSELVTGATPVVDPAPFRFERFAKAA